MASAQISISENPDASIKAVVTSFAMAGLMLGGTLTLALQKEKTTSGDLSQPKIEGVVTDRWSYCIKQAFEQVRASHAATTIEETNRELDTATRPCLKFVHS